jgi:hypothetical protein
VGDIATDIGGFYVEGRGAENLLLKAIKSLPREEQDEVLKLIVGRAFATPSGPSPLQALDVFPAGPVTVVPGPGADIVKQMTAPLLVRLPADLHDRLRRWSTTNGFSMAAVARGLIERFLNDQERTRKESATD